MFTSSECFDMLVLYGQCDESATVAAQEYAVRFPNREHPAKISRVQMKPWAGEALETVNCCAFLKRRLIGVC
jgi:hypothetical protein